MHVAFLGFGLIGGSIARALRRDAGFADRITRVDARRAPGRAAAAGDGIEAPRDGRPTRSAAPTWSSSPAPPLGLPRPARRAGRAARPRDLGPDAVVTDVASTKAAIVDRARSRGLRFVGGHPMAGRETSGYGAADPDLFAGRPWVIVPADPRRPGGRRAGRGPRRGVRRAGPSR